MAKTELKLDSRLAAIASMVRPGMRCADIGTDHGYLITWLAIHNVITGGYACDINEKPLEKAAFTLSEHQVPKKIVKLVCADGLAGIDSGSVDDIVIAGMGGELIWEIISVQPWIRDPKLRLILQPMTKAHKLRKSLLDNGFVIEKEKAVQSGSHIYTVMQVAYAGRVPEYDLITLYMGALDKADPATALYAGKIAAMLHKKASGMKKSGASKTGYEQEAKLLHQLESGWLS